MLFVFAGNAVHQREGCLKQCCGAVKLRHLNQWIGTKLTFLCIFVRYLSFSHLTLSYIL